MSPARSSVSRYPEATDDLVVDVRRFAELLRERYRPNLAVEGATERYHTWRGESPTRRRGRVATRSRR